MPVELHHGLVFKVIVSQDNEYSLWLLDREDPPGWRDTGTMRGTAPECLAHIKKSRFEKHQLKQQYAGESRDLPKAARATSA